MTTIQLRYYKPTGLGENKGRRWPYLTLITEVKTGEVKYFRRVVKQYVW